MPSILGRAHQESDFGAAMASGGMDTLPHNGAVITRLSGAVLAVFVVIAVYAITRIL